MRFDPYIPASSGHGAFAPALPAARRVLLILCLLHFIVLLSMLRYAWRELDDGRVGPADVLVPAASALALYAGIGLLSNTAGRIRMLFWVAGVGLAWSAWRWGVATRAGIELALGAGLALAGLLLSHRARLVDAARPW